MATKEINEFLKELTAKTGLYGNELFDEIRRRMGLLEERKIDTSDRSPIVGEVRWRGTREEALQYIIDKGATETEQKLFKASSYAFAAAQLASFARATKFYWEFPLRTANGVYTGEANGFWNPKTNKYDIFDEKIIFPKKPYNFG